MVEDQQDIVLAYLFLLTTSLSLSLCANRLPPPGECDLYYVNRDTLFSYHKDSELFLQVMMQSFTKYIAMYILFYSCPPYYITKSRCLYNLILAANDGSIRCFSLQKFSK